MQKIYLLYTEEEALTYYRRPDEKVRLQGILRRLGITIHTIVGKSKLVIYIDMEKL